MNLLNQSERWAGRHSFIHSLVHTFILPEFAEHHFNPESRAGACRARGLGPDSCVPIEGSSRDRFFGVGGGVCPDWRVLETFGEEVRSGLHPESRGLGRFRVRKGRRAGGRPGRRLASQVRRGVLETRAGSGTGCPGWTVERELVSQRGGGREASPTGL